MKLEEVPVNLERARHILGGQRTCELCSKGGASRDCVECAGLGRVATPWSRSYMTEIKKAMGIKSRFFLVSDVRKWMRDHPDFKIQKTPKTETVRALLSEALDYMRTSKVVGRTELIERIEKKLAA